MKICPQCHQTFTDDNFFCLEDGTPLPTDAQTAQYPPVFQTSGNDQTLVIPRAPTPQPTQPQQLTSSGSSSKWLFLIIGVLATALVGLGAYTFLPREKQEKFDKLPAVVQNSNAEQATKTNPVAVNKPENVAPQTAPNTNATRLSANTPAALSEPNPNLTPTGSWSGDWSSKTTYFTAEATLTETTGGRVTGQIVWTIRRTSNPKKTDKIGTSAVEEVQGTFNPSTRILTLRGIRKNDPNNIIILDRYNLSLAADNQTLMGKSIGGTLTLRR
jgi:hypothetical protein